VDRDTDTTAPGHTDRIARAAWLCAFVLPLILAALLLGAKSSQAAPSIPGLAPLALEEELGLEEEDEQEEAEFAELECELAEEEAAEGEISAAEADAVCREAEEIARGGAAGPSSATGKRCPLRSAHAHASLRGNKLKLTIGYTTARATGATVEVRSGKKRIASVHRRLGRSGVLRITKKLGKKRPTRVSVSFKTRSCAKLQTGSTRVR